MTEKSGRIHTSAISVAILPQADEVIINYLYELVARDVELECLLYPSI